MRITAGYYHNLAIDSDNFVMAWGKNDLGQLGDGTNTNKNSAVFVNSEGVLKGKNIDLITAGSFVFQIIQTLYSLNISLI